MSTSKKPIKVTAEVLAHYKFMVKKLLRSYKELLDRFEVFVKESDTPKTLEELKEEVDQLSNEDRIELGSYCLSK